MTLTADVQLNPSRRVGGLRAAANPLGGDWQRGLDAGGNGCLAPVRLAPCAVGDAEAQRPSTPAKWLPVTVRQIVECSSLGVAAAERVKTYAQGAGDVTVDYAMALELFDGAGSGTNPSLSDATVVGEVTGITDASDSLAAAIACAEAAAATGLSGRIAFVHVPQGLSIYLPSSVRLDGSGVWRTPAGNVVVISPGYSGTSIFATGEVWVASERIGTRVFTDRSDNTDRAWDDQLVLAVFDPCFNVEVTTDIPECSPPSQ